MNISYLVKILLRLLSYVDDENKSSISSKINKNTNMTRIIAGINGILLI